MREITKVPSTLRTPGSSGIGAPAQHSENLEDRFAHAPRLRAVLPSNLFEIKGLLIAAIEDDNPVIFVEHNLPYKTKGPVPEEIYTGLLDKTNIARPGKDLTIIAMSLVVNRLLQAAEQLAGEGSKAEVINTRTLRPLDDAHIIGAPVRRLGGPSNPIPYNRNLEYHTVPQVENIVAEARKLARNEVHEVSGVL